MKQESLEFIQAPGIVFMSLWALGWLPKIAATTTKVNVFLFTWRRKRKTFSSQAIQSHAFLRWTAVSQSQWLEDVMCQLPGPAHP